MEETMKTKILLTLLVALNLGVASAAAQEAATDTATSEAAEAAPAGAGCTPACREGFSCVDGECVSKCNPPCGEGEKCTALGHCVAEGGGGESGAASGEVPLMVSGQPDSTGAMGPGDPGWGYEAFVLGLISTAAATGLAAGSAVTHGEPESAYLGLAALGTFTVACPVLAFGGMSARSNPIHRGYPTARTMSWIGYGVTLAGGIALGAAALGDEEIGPGWIVSVGTVGVLTMVGFTVDAYASASQAESPVGQLGTVPSYGLTPSLALGPEPEGGMTGSLGVAGWF
jgi:hypothetical protein